MDEMALRVIAGICIGQVAPVFSFRHFTEQMGVADDEAIKLLKGLERQGHVRRVYSQSSTLDRLAADSYELTKWGKRS